MGRFFGPRRQLLGKRAIVTGASTGIGRSLATHLARAGVRQLLLARNAEKLAEVAAAIRTAGGEAIELAGDVTDPTVRQVALDKIKNEFGGLDLLINNAGIGAYGRFVEVSPDRLRSLMEVNLFAPAEFLREATPLLRQSDDGVVVNVGSILGYRGLPFSSEYSASKFAIHGLSEAVRPELKKIGIDLLMVVPGNTNTEFSDNVVDDQGDPPWTRRGGVSSDYVAEATLRALQQCRTLVVPNPQGRWLLLANRLVPSLVDRVMNRYG